MEGALSDPPKGEVWKTLGHQNLLELLLLTLHILALAVHLHTVNAHHFETGGFYERLAEALLQLGCFHPEGSETENWDAEKCSCPKTAEESQSPGNSFLEFVELAHTTVSAASSSTSPQPNLPLSLRTCIRLLSYLDQFSTGTYSPQELHLGQHPDYGGDEDQNNLHGPTGYEGAYSEPSLAFSGSGPQSAEDKQGRFRNTSSTSSTFCTETQDR